MTKPSAAAGSICWESPANIAMIKYWGKYPGQLPMNPSLSFVLKKSVVRICLHYEKSENGQLEQFLLNGMPNPAFMQRISGYLLDMHAWFPFLSAYRLRIDSESTFPHSAGIASSAAAFSALALCLCSLSQVVTGKLPEIDSRQDDSEQGLTDHDKLIQTASFFSRLGSGSACRSLESGFVLWGRTPLVGEGSDQYGFRLPSERVHPQFQSIQDAILIVDDTTKKVSSSAGHALMQKHPYRESRIAHVSDNLGLMLEALRSGDEKLFMDVAVNEALTLHSLMMSSSPGYMLMRPQTIEILERIEAFRKESGLSVGYTMDAGPNVHLLYFAHDAAAVKSFISGHLLAHCKGGRWISDSMGHGPVSLT